MKKIFIFCMIALVAICGLNSCNDCDHDFIEVDYSKSIIGVWSSESERYEEGIRFYEDGKFSAFGNKGEGDYFVDGTWALQQNRLVLTTNEGKMHFSGTIEVYAEDVMLMTSDGSKDTHVYHYFVDSPFPKSLVGTWTCLEGNFAEALTINEDGSLVSTRLEGGNYWEGIKGTFMEEGGTYGIELNSNYYFGTYEVVSGELLALIDTKTNTRRTYRYCKEDLSDEIVGMWVCTEEVFGQEEESVGINTYTENGKSYLTAFLPDAGGYVNQLESNYKVVGDLLIGWMNDGSGMPALYQAFGLNIIPNGTELGDIMTVYNPVYGTNPSFLRVKQSLDLAGQNYNYIKTYVSNVKGEDKDIDFMGYTFNFAKMDGSGLDKMLKALLFAVEFPDANTLGYSYQMNGNKETYNSPIVVEGNKMTIKMSAKVPTLKDVVLYAFQDADCSQMHFYMHKTAFVSFYTNMQAMLMAATNEQFDITNAEAVNAIYDNINNAVETINVSLVMSK